MSVRCERCGTTLIHEAVGHSSAYRSAEKRVNANVYGGAGAFAGFAIVGVAGRIMGTEGLGDNDMRVAALLAAAAGWLLGRYIAHKQSAGLD